MYIFHAKHRLHCHIGECIIVYKIYECSKTNVVDGHATRQAKLNIRPPKPNTNLGRKSFFL